MLRLNRQIPVTTSGRTHPYHPIVRPRISSASLCLLLISLCGGVFGQTPFSIPFTCNEDQMQFTGAVCSPSEPCPIYVELNTIFAQRDQIFIAGNLHTDSATFSSILLASADAGLSWKEPVERLQGRAFDQIQFADAQHGWAAGETQNPLPRDPFVELTTDGGNTWREYAVSEEGTPGAVVRFWFDSARHGELIVDAGRAAAGGRYQVYESETGGTSWTLHSKTDDMPKQPVAHEPTDVRIRPAKDGKTLAIETLAGTVWHSQTSIPIEAARCGFEPGQLKEPEPAPEPPVKK